MADDIMDDIETTTRTSHTFEGYGIPAGWRRGNMFFVGDPTFPGGVRHDVFAYDDKVKYEDRRPNGEDARWFSGSIVCYEETITKVRLDTEEYLTRTGLFAEERADPSYRYPEY